MAGTLATYTEGVGWRRPTVHSGLRRHRSHDYRAPGTYLVTIVTADRRALLGSIEGDCNALPGSPTEPRTAPSLLGKAVLDTVLPTLARRYPMVEVWHRCLMPDHIHLIVRVREQLPERLHLGNIVAAFKTLVTQANREIESRDLKAAAQGRTTTQGLTTTQGRTAAQGQTATPLTPATTGNSPRAAAFRSPLEPIFEPGYNDRILMREGQLANWHHYLDDNPRRLLMRRTRPELLRRALCLTVGGTRYSAFGNFLLLRKPEKLQVFCHRQARYRHLTVEERQRHGIVPLPAEAVTPVPYETTTAFAHERDALLAEAANGTPLVSPAISRGELAVKNDCLRLGLPFIHLQREPVTPLWKPELSRFRACCNGTLLILAPWPADISGDTGHELFHNLNALAAMLCQPASTMPDASVRMQ